MTGAKIGCLVAYHVVVVSWEFGGRFAASALRWAPADVTLIGRNWDAMFQPAAKPAGHEHPARERDCAAHMPQAD